MIFFDKIKIKEASTLGVPKEFEVAGGLTKREFFAGLAMQGLLACYDLDADAGIPNKIINASIWYADALIKELECQKPTK